MNFASAPTQATEVTYDDPGLIPFLSQFGRPSQARRRKRPQAAPEYTEDDHENTLIPPCLGKRRGAEPEDLSRNPGEDLNRRWYEAVTGRMPIGRHIVALCYATAVILLEWWPWNILLILLLLPGGNNRLRFRALDTKRERSL